MKKQIFTLLALLLTVCSGAWAASVSDLVAISSDYTFIADNITSNGTVKLTKNTLYDSNRIFAPTANSVANNKGNSTFAGGEHLNSLRLKNDQDQLCFKVGGACTVTFYTQSHASRGLQVGSSAAGTEYGLQTASTPVWSCEIPSAGVVYLSSYSGDFYIAGFTVTFKAATSEVLKTSAAVKVGGTALTKDAGTNGYSVDGTTITLTNDVTAISTPTNVKLVKTITYSDSSTKDEDVDVSFDGTITAGYYIGTASIGLTGSVTNYTVKVKQNVSPAAELSATSGSIALTESWKVGTVTFTLTGANLTDGTYDVTADVAGATITPTSFTVADGAVSQVFTITSTDNTAATTVFTIGSVGMGVAAPTYTLTYSQSAAKRVVSQTNVSDATTWDWSKSGGASIQLLSSSETGGPTNPENGEEFLLAKLPEITNDATFNSQALKVSCQWPNRGGYFQGNTVKFTTTVPGTVEVWFSNTSNRDDNAKNRRYLYVNGTNSGKYTLDQDFKTSGAMAVAVGEVVINAFTGEATPAATMVRINKIVFTPVTSVSGTITDAGWSTFASSYPLDLSTISGGTAYYASAASGSTVTLSTTTATVPAGEGIMVKGTAGETFTIDVAASGTAISGNLLKGQTTTGNVAASTAGAYHYVFGFSKSDASVYGFYNLAADTEVTAGKAYLETTTALTAGARVAIVFEDEATAIEAVKAQNIENGQFFNLAGQRVAQPQKGLYIVNGKKVIIK